MSDLINRQDAIDALQAEINKAIPPFDDAVGAIRCGVRLARNIIEDLPSAQPELIACGEGELKSESQWIPVSERLPEKEFNLYIVTYKMSAEDFRTGISDFCHGTWAVRPHGEVIAWMPLPNPYKETEE